MGLDAVAVEMTLGVDLEAEAVGVLSLDYCTVIGSLVLD